MRFQLLWLAVAGTLFICGCQRANENANRGADGANLTAAQLAAHDRAVGLMGQFDYAAAFDEFAQLAEQLPDWPDVKVDWAIASLNRRQDGDVPRAQKLLDTVIQAEPTNLRAKYCRALLALYAAEPEKAFELFQDVAQADSADGYAVYYAGQCLLEQQQYEAAFELFQRAQEADPYLRSAYYGAFQSLQRLGRADEAKANLEIFQRLTDNPQARSAEIKYSRMGPKAEAQATRGSVTPPSPPAGTLFADQHSPFDPPSNWRSPAADRPVSVTACDINQDGLIDLFVAGAVASPAGQTQNAIVWRTKTGWELAADHPLAKVKDVHAALWGDFNNDTLTDVYLCRAGQNQLWQQAEGGQWTNVTAATGTAGGDRQTVDGAMFDADHDGDLDLYLVNRDGPNELLNNNLNGTFRPLGEQQGVAGDGRGSLGVAIADLDNDRDADIIVLNDQPPHDVYINDRLWNYSPGVGFDQLCEMPCLAAVAVDVDADGRTEIISSTKDGWYVWRRDASDQWQGEPIELPGFQPAAGPLAVQDLDGDGQQDLLATTTAGWLAARVFSAGDQGSVQHASISGPWCLAMTEPNRGWSLVAATATGLQLWPPGPGRYAFADLQFTGKENKADQMRSNASGIGIRAAARVAGDWTALQTFRDQSGPGQSRQPVPVGLAGQRAVDFVSLLWPDGLFQTELGLLATGRQRIEETQRQVSSCPVLFVWDGQQHRFVSDVLGVGGLGFNHGRGQYHQPRPWENLLLPADLPVPTKLGTYQVKIGEPMEEACYLDATRMVAYDLPPGWQMTMDERQSVGDPVATGEPIFYRRHLSPTAVWNERGEALTERLAAADGLPAPTGTRDPRFLARTAEFSVTLEFNSDLTQLTGRPVLVIDGWVEYPYSQTMFAAWQAGASYDTPRLEARASGQKWQTIYPEFGYPAGMPRQMSLPIDPGLLPAGTTQLRITTNLEVYWDRIFLAIAEPCPEVQKLAAPLLAAIVQEVGFPLRTNSMYRQPSFDYARRVPLWDTRHTPGSYTQLGAATPLVTQVDDAVAIIGPGEEVALEFAALNRPPPADGWTRRFVLECHGWCKDMDLYTQHGEGLEPLPRRARGSVDDGERAALHERYNTRYRAGQ